MTLLLDVDGVLVGWADKPGDESGFSDWKPRTPDQFAVKWTSAEQLALIADSFEDIQWHTTWIGRYSGVPLVNSFTNWFDFGPFPTLVNKLDLVEEIPRWGNKPWQREQWEVGPGSLKVAVPLDAIPEDLWATLETANWWKLNAVAALLTADLLPGKIVWADDDILGERPWVFKVLKHFNATDRFRLISPQSVLIRRDIEEAAVWLES